MTFNLPIHPLSLVSAKSWQVSAIAVQKEYASEHDVRDGTSTSFIDQKNEIPGGKGSQS